MTPEEVKAKYDPDLTDHQRHDKAEEYLCEARRAWATCHAYIQGVVNMLAEAKNYNLQQTHKEALKCEWAATMLQQAVDECEGSLFHAWERLPFDLSDTPEPRNPIIE